VFCGFIQQVCTVLFGVVVSLLHLVSTITLEGRESLCNRVFDADESM